MSPFSVEWFGRVPYARGLVLQDEAVEARRRGDAPDRLLLLEHPPVVTLGSSSHDRNLLVPREVLAARGIEVHPARRGGDVTYHAPGQLVGYLVMDLAARGARDVHRFLRAMESALMAALAGLGLETRRIEGMTGVYLERVGESGPDRKIASIGIGVRHWITCHGFALNVSLDLAGFDVIVPCGLRDVEMTSLSRELRVPARDAGALERRARAAVETAFRERFAGYGRAGRGDRDAPCGRAC